jgi:hypothetical protein
VNRKLYYIACLALSGCVHRYVDAPTPTHEGSFFVHVVKAPDESFPKILTWYTGTTLSQEIVMRYNPYLQQRGVKVGDRVLIPVELIANEHAYGTAPHPAQSQTPNLLMGESAPNLLMEGKKKGDVPASPPPQATPMNDLPSMTLETFNDDTNPDGAHQETGPTPAQAPSRVEQLQKEIDEKRRELELLQATKGPDAPAGTKGDEDMPPPGLLQEFEGS